MPGCRISGMRRKRAWLGEFGSSQIRRRRGTAMLNVVLFQPEIPPNTGNVIRLCANTGAALHLVGPLGFSLDDARLRRAGLDYHDMAQVRQYADWDDYRARGPGARLWAFSTRGRQALADTRFANGDGLLFGPETSGLPGWLLQQFGPERIVRIPMRAGSRSLNLSNTVAVVTYEALRQLDYPGLA